MVGLVHDYLLVMRGAERTFAAMADCWPDAPIYTLLYDERGTHGEFEGRIAATSYLQHLPLRQRGFRMLLPVLPHAVEHLRLGDHSVVVSSSSAFGHGVIAPAEAVHICYCHSPFRYVWHERHRALEEFPSALRPLGSALLDRIRDWEVRAARRVDHFIANSQITRERIADAWDRDAVVVHPPVNTDRFFLGAPEDFLLVVAELVPHKRVDAALEAARRADRPIKVVGEGPSLGSLRARFGDRAEFLGRADDGQLADLMSRALALVVPNVEEFGIAAVEAQAAGRPVIAPDRGGTWETVIDGVTGALYPAGDVDALAQAMRDVDFERFDGRLIRRHALSYGADVFKARLLEEVERMTGRGQPRAGDRAGQADGARSLSDAALQMPLGSRPMTGRQGER